jgi:hypothetical protein
LQRAVTDEAEPGLPGSAPNPVGWSPARCRVGLPGRAWPGGVRQVTRIEIVWLHADTTFLIVVHERK